MKNRFMKLAAVLLVLTLITSCFVGGTFAKYTTSTTGSDTARVAYWGFGATNSITFENLFLNSYTDAVGKDGAKIIAPGTENSATFTFNYPSGEAAPEVDYKIEVSASVTGLTNTDATNELADKIQWKLGENGTYGTFEELQTAIATLSVTDGKAGTAPTTITGTIYWQWAFETDDTSDTELGNAESLANISVTITVAVTQVNTTPTT